MSQEQPIAHFESHSSTRKVAVILAITHKIPVDTPNSSVHLSLSLQEQHDTVRRLRQDYQSRRKTPTFRYEDGSRAAEGESVYSVFPCLEKNGNRDTHSV
jgi:hypothetical protein